MTSSQVLVVDDEADIRALIQDILSDEGYGVTISDEISLTKFLNASICTESYRPENAPHLIRIRR